MFVSTVAVNNTFLQGGLDRIILNRVGRTLPIIQLNHRSSRHIILPLFALQDSEQEVVFVIKTSWYHDLVLFAVLAELLQVGLFLLTQFDLGEDQSLVAAVLDGQELLVDGGFEVAGGGAELVDLHDLVVALGIYLCFHFD